MKKQYITPVTENVSIDPISICAGSPPREDGTGNDGGDEAKRWNGNFYEAEEWPSYSAWEE